MDINTYARRKENILRRMLAALFHVFQEFLRGFMRPNDWNTFVHVTYRVMKPYRDEATELARVFHDDNRAAQLPSLPSSERQDQIGHDIFKDDYYPEEWFRREMTVLFQHSQQGRGTDALVEEAVNRVTKVVEDGARRTLIDAVRTDTDLPIRGIARFDPRPPTCAFCTMMISRGPVYHTSGKTAGWSLDVKRLERFVLDDDPDKINELMNKWHPGCTCIAVPVYKYDNYPTQSQEKEAEQIYLEGRKRAKALANKLGTKLTTRLILNEMRKVIYNPKTEQDQTSLARNVA